MSVLAMSNAMRFCVFEPRLAAVEDVIHVFTEMKQINPEDDYLSPIGIEISRGLLRIPYVNRVELKASETYDELDVTHTSAIVLPRERAEVSSRVHQMVEAQLGKPLVLNSQSYHLQIQVLKAQLTAGS